MLWLIVLIIVITAFSTAIFANLRCVIIYKDKKLTVKIGGKYALITVYNNIISKKDEKPKDYIKIPTFDNLKNKIKNLKRVFSEEKNEIILILKTLNSNIEVEALNAAVTFGFGDAAITGIANGLIWSALTAAHGFLLRYIDIQNVTNLAVCPKYTKKCFDVEVTFIFSTKLIKTIEVWRQLKKLIERNEFQFKD